VLCLLENRRGSADRSTVSEHRSN